jgi:pilus assembly protein CpaC
MKLPGVQQVMLQVRIAELNRTALREIGADTFFKSGPGNIVGTSIAGATPPILQGMTDGMNGMNGMDGLNGMMNAIGPDLGPNSTAFGIFPKVRMDIIIRALRENAVLRVLAEPNLVALSGHEASFLAGGEFPVPVAQGGALGAGNITVQYKEFGVQLNFVPYILDDEVIRLEVRPEVSSIDDRLGTTLVVGGDPTPGVNTRRVHTTVQMREGETLALAGLLLVNLEASTSRIPGLGDLPYIGPLFSNTSHFKQEKELLVLVTPYLVSPMDSCDAPPLPGAEIQDPNDLEFYFLNRIEGRTGQGFRSTTAWQDPYHLVRLLKLERDHICGPAGFSSYPVQVSESK